MDWGYVLEKYTNKKKVKCPVLDAFVEKKLEIKDYKNQSRREENYVRNWVVCNDVDLASLTAKDWRKIWADQYWHLFVSWFAMADGADYEAKVRAAQSTELWIWLYESQGLFRGKEAEIISEIEKIDELEGERLKWRKRIFEAAGISEGPSWKNLAELAHWEDEK